MTNEQLKEILSAHGKWRRNEDGGSRADLARAYLADAYLAGANLARADLAGANLACADLTDAYLADADLAGAYLARAYLAGADLAGADLACADLARADLTGANLACANLTDANLTGANLTGANLACANLARANLTGATLADANLTDADLAGADLTGANLAGADNIPDGTSVSDPAVPYVRAKGTTIERAERYRQRHPDVPVVENLDAKILAAITTGGGRLDMGQWHSCETTHCRAGWAITLAGEAGRKLEEKCGPRWAGAMIYRASTGRAPFFFATDADALEDIKRCAAEQMTGGAA